MNWMEEGILCCQNLFLAFRETSDSFRTMVIIPGKNTLA